MPLHLHLTIDQFDPNALQQELDAKRARRVRSAVQYSANRVTALGLEETKLKQKLMKELDMCKKDLDALDKRFVTIEKRQQTIALVFSELGLVTEMRTTLEPEKDA